MSDDLLFGLLEDPAALARYRSAKAFLDCTIFAGLADLRPWFDSAEIKHFRADDFRTVINRCTEHGVLLIGIEVFTPKAELETVELAADVPRSNQW
jgi:hypothetical protein